jgi:hypothetical protein
MKIALLVLAAFVLIIVAIAVVILRRRNGSRRNGGSLATPQPLHVPAPPPPPDALIIGDCDSPLVAIAPCDLVELTPVKTSTSDAMITALGPLLQKAPEIFRLGKDMVTRSFKVVFSPAAMEALNSGDLQMLKDAGGNLLPVLHKNGRFVENGRVVVQGGIKLANLAAMSWQVASVITAQKFLSDINTKLKAIEGALEDVLFLLEEDKLSRLRSYIDLLRQYHPAISRGQLHPLESAAIYQKIEDLEHECLAIAKYGEQLSEKRRSELLSVEKDTWLVGSIAQAGLSRLYGKTRRR